MHAWGGKKDISQRDGQNSPAFRSKSYIFLEKKKLYKKEYISWFKIKMKSFRHCKACKAVWAATQCMKSVCVCMHVGMHLTSILWELTFLPFLFQTTCGFGSPAAWHTKDTTPPDTPIWSVGIFVNLGEAGGNKYSVTNAWITKKRKKNVSSYCI